MTFANGKEMLSKIQEGTDLYDPETYTYVFVYNEDGAICTYDISHEDADKLKQMDDYWGAHLGWGGSIYDTPMNLSWCEDNYKGDWEDVTK